MIELNKLEILHKEIDLIQGCINRMAHNSFVVKGWLISLVAVVLTLLPDNFDIKILCVVGVLATCCMWFLDAFFLTVEKLYRWKYDWVISKRLHTDEYIYDLNPYNENMWLLDNSGRNKQKPTVKKTMFSKTLIPIYIPTLFVIVFVFINSYVNFI